MVSVAVGCWQIRRPNITVDWNTSADMTQIGNIIKYDKNYKNKKTFQDAQRRLVCHNSSIYFTIGRKEKKQPAIKSKITEYNIYIQSLILPYIREAVNEVKAAAPMSMPPHIA